MSRDAYIELEADTSGLMGAEPLPDELRDEGSSYGKNVARNFDWIDTLCAKLGIRPFSDFVVDSEVVDSQISVETSGSHPGPWFEADEALPIAERLAEYVDSMDPEDEVEVDTGRLEAKWLQWDLRVYVAILRRAAISNRRFRVVRS